MLHLEFICFKIQLWNPHICRTICISIKSVQIKPFSTDKLVMLQKDFRCCMVKVKVGVDYFGIYSPEFLYNNLDLSMLN